MQTIPHSSHEDLVRPSADASRPLSPGRPSLLCLAMVVVVVGMLAVPMSAASEGANEPHLEAPRAGAPGAAEEETYRVVPFEFVFFPSDYGPPPTEKRLSLYFLASEGDRLEGAQIGLGLGFIRGPANGAQISVGANVAQGAVDGAQISVGANVAQGEVSGTQIAVGSSWAGGEMHGTQMAVGSSWVGGEMHGNQMAVGSSWAGGGMHGNQMAVGLAYAGGDSSGLQAAVGASISGGRTEGLQLATGLNYAAQIEGAQIGSVNVTGRMEGAQIGLINLAAVADGPQIGLINLAKESDAPIGLLNLVGNGRFRAGLWGDDLGTATLGIKTGSQTVYSILQTSLSPDRRDGAVLWGWGAGLGIHTDVAWSWLHSLDVDLSSRQLVHGTRAFGRDGGGTLIQSLRVGGGWHLAPRFALVAGPSLNLGVRWGEDREALGLIPGVELSSKGSRSTVRLWPGFFLGVEI